MSSTETAVHTGFPQALSGFQTTFDQWLETFLRQKAVEAEALDSDLALAFNQLTSFTTRSGKRLRPFLVLWGYRAAGGFDDAEVIPIAAAAEMLHVFALAHDDVMDQAGLRRGLPTLHKLAEAEHSASGWRGSSEQFGVSMAILIGDLAFALSDGLIDHSNLGNLRLARVRSTWNTMREEVIQGQFLDVLASNRREPAPEEQIWKILSFKSGKYTLERPLHLGAAAAGAPEALFNLFTRFGVPLGRAFQIQDDILGVFGEPDEVGKSVDSDIKEGKSTLLISRAYQNANPAGRSRLIQVWGNPDAAPEDIADVRQIILQTGSLDYATLRANELMQEALQAIAGSSLSEQARSVLAGLAEFVLHRKV